MTLYFKIQVPVTVHILDQNDNRPQSGADHYEVWADEDLRPGQLITELSASDEDSGMYGSQGIRWEQGELEGGRKWTFMYKKNQFSSPCPVNTGKDNCEMY